MFEVYIKSFAEKLDAINDSLPELKDFSAEKFELLLQHKEYHLKICAHVLEKALKHSIMPKEEIVFLDYESTGLLALFAKHCGFKKVYLNNVDQNFIKAANWLNLKLGNTIDGIIEGDWNAVEIFFKDRDVPDVIAGINVIQHIYNPDIFFTNIKRLNSRIITVFTTTSVTANPIIKYWVKKLQRDYEHNGSNVLDSPESNVYAGLSFLETRKKIIKQFAPQLQDLTVNELAVATRGLKYDNIIEACKHFVSDGLVPITLRHSTNTCDPITGLWIERLLSVDEYNRIYVSAGFTLQVYNGFYNSLQQGLKGKLLNIVNWLIKIYGYQGIYISPFITLAGKPK